MKRLFAAIKIPPGEIALANYYRLKKALSRDRIKWVEPRNFHLTFKFFGDTPEDEIERIGSVLHQLAGQHAPFNIALSKTGVFGSRYAPRVIWFGFAEEPVISRFGNTVLDALEQAGYARDRQNFVPHLTIARIQDLTDKRNFQASIGDVAEFETEPVTSGDLVLFESILSREGPRYVPLQRYPFAGDSII